MPRTLNILEDLQYLEDGDTWSSIKVRRPPPLHPRHLISAPYRCSTVWRMDYSWRCLLLWFVCACFFFCGAQNETEIKNWNSIKFQPANPDRKVTPEHWLLRGNNLYHTQLNPKQLNCQLRCHPNPLFIHIHLFFDFGSSFRLPEDREDVVICWLSPGDGK